MARKAKEQDPESRGQGLAEELNDTLEAEFPPRAKYREAVEAVVGFFESVLAGLDADERRDRKAAEGVR